MKIETFIKKWEIIRTKDRLHYVLLNSVFATLAFLGFTILFHWINRGSERIISDFNGYALSCAGIFAGSAIGSFFGWNVKEDPYQDGEAIWLSMKNK